MTGNRIIRQYIVEDPRWPDPTEARIVRYGVRVWALIGYLRAVDGDVSRVAHDYDLPEEAVHDAIAHYQRHRKAIDARLTENAVPSV